MGNVAPNDPAVANIAWGGHRNQYIGKLKYFLLISLLRATEYERKRGDDAQPQNNATTLCSSTGSGTNFYAAVQSDNLF